VNTTAEKNQTGALKIDYLSDLHLEFYRTKNFPDLRADDGTIGDVLVLAGDIMVLKHLDVRRTDKRSRFMRDIYREFFTYISSLYEKIFYVTGNHEFYGDDIINAYGSLHDTLADFPNVECLDRRAVKYEGVHFIGVTLWTDFGRQNPLVMNFAKDKMNDYFAIYVNKKKKRKLTVEEVLDKHEIEKGFIENCLENSFDKRRTVVITHHSPTYHAHDATKPVNMFTDLFHVNMEYLMTRNKHIDAWIFGHTHHKYKQDIYGTTVCSNPVGYLGQEKMSKFWVPERVEV
jgi:Icc-related predicted phosphoesterase